MKIVKLQILLIVLMVAAHSQEKNTAGKITYVSGDVVYTSLGRNSGIEDSTLFYVILKNDTIGVLKVFATSSKSSACKIIKKKLPLNIGDFVSATIGLPHPPEQNRQSPLPDSITPQPVQPIQPAQIVKQNIVDQRLSRPVVSVEGSVSLQYFMTGQSAANPTMSQPGVVLNLRGKVNDLPLKFRIYGNFRTLIYRSAKPLNLTRLYQASVDYDDNVNQISAGRMILSLAPSIGYLDGIMLARRFGNFIFGSAAGFDPNSAQQGLPAGMRKFSFFGGYRSAGSTNFNVNLAYGRTFLRSETDREVISSSFSAVPASTIFFTAQSDVDLRTKKAQSLILKPQLTNFSAVLNYRALNYLAVGFGMSAWRSVYKFALVKVIPDSMLDRNLRFNPTISLNLYPLSGVSLYNTFTPRSSDNAFGREYCNLTTLGLSNLFGQGVSFRGTMTINNTMLTRTRGYGVNMQKTFINIGDLNLRYQFYRSDITHYSDINTNSIIGLDLMVSALSNVSFWGSLERLIGAGRSATTISAEISWRF